MNNGFITLHRKITEWEWYQDPNTFRLFLHLLLTANHKDKNWQGTLVKRGQVITGVNALSIATGLTPQKIRTAFNKLKSTNEIIIKSTNKFSLITLVKYSSYQDKDGASNKQTTNNQQSSNKPITTTNNDNNDNNDNNIISDYYLELKNDNKKWFDKFWKAFNLKEGKQASAHAWLEINKLDKEKATHIINSAKKEATRQRPQGQARLYPANWLKQMKYDDYDISVKKSQVINKTMQLKSELNHFKKLYKLKPSSELQEQISDLENKINKQ